MSLNYDKHGFKLSITAGLAGRSEGQAALDTRPSEPHGISLLRP